MTFIAGQESTTVLNKRKNWAAAVGQIKIQETAGSQPTIQVQLSGVEVRSIIEQAVAVDNQGGHYDIRERSTAGVVGHASTASRHGEGRNDVSAGKPARTDRVRWHQAAYPSGGQEPSLPFVS